jgi:hypothetical protein
MLKHSLFKKVLFSKKSLWRGKFEKMFVIKKGDGEKKRKKILVEIRLDTSIGIFVPRITDG